MKILGKLLTQLIWYSRTQPAKNKNILFFSVHDLEHNKNENEQPDKYKQNGENVAKIAIWSQIMINSKKTREIK